MKAREPPEAHLSEDRPYRPETRNHGRDACRTLRSTCWEEEDNPQMQVPFLLAGEGQRPGRVREDGMCSQTQTGARNVSATEKKSSVTIIYSKIKTTDF